MVKFTNTLPVKTNYLMFVVEDEYIGVDRISRPEALRNIASGNLPHSVVPSTIKEFKQKQRKP